MSETATNPATEPTPEPIPEPVSEPTPAPEARPTLKTHRGLIKWWFFSLITCGIYTLYFIHAMAKELNISCEGDGKKTKGLILYCLFSCLTLGIYALVWWIGVCNRMNARIAGAGEQPKVSGMSWFLWMFFGSCIVVGPFIAMHKAVHGLNKVNALYNEGR